MTPDQTKMILAKAALIDSRIVDLAVIKAWHEVIGRFDYEDALAALNLHRLESTEYLLPAHIKSNITRAKAMRASSEARQRAIETARVCKLIEEGGDVPTPANIEVMREMLANIGRMDRPALVAEVADENDSPKPSLYERLANSPEGQAHLGKSA